MTPALSRAASVTADMTLSQKQHEKKQLGWVVQWLAHAPYKRLNL